jgi:hypothetical protein
MLEKILTKADLIQFTGSESLFRHSLIRHIRYTEGVQYVAETAGAYWLIDEITFNQVAPAVAAEEFQHWKLVVDLERHAAILTCDDGNDVVVLTKRIEFTDFPLDEIRFYFVDNTILLPSEY